MKQKQPTRWPSFGARRKSHPTISPGQPFIYLGRSMRVTTVSRKLITAHYVNNSGNIQTITIPTDAAKTCIPTPTDSPDTEIDNDNDPRFVELN